MIIFDLMRRLALVWWVVLLVGCETEVIIPNRPTSNAPTGSVLVVDGSESLRTEQAELFGATITLTDGTTGPAPRPAWASSNSEVASVSDAGVVTGHNQGETTISATLQGLGGQKTVRVWQNYHGTWIGTYVVRTCIDARVTTMHWCAAIPRGSSLPFVLTLIQTESAVRGTLSLGQFQGPATGGIFADGRVIGSASLSALIDTSLRSWKVGTLELLVDGETKTGSLVAETTSREPKEAAYWEFDLASVTRVSFTAPVTGALAPAVGPSPNPGAGADRSSRP